MALRIDLTFDTRDAVTLAEFWKLALGYEDEPPPAPFTTRDEWAASFGEDPDDDGGGGAWLQDPDGVAAGGTIQATFDGHHIVMADPEGNEFCVAA